MKVDRGIGNKKYYDRYKGRKWKYYRYILADTVQYSKPGKILDIGAGTGLFVECANRWGFKCEGVDGSKWAVSVGKNLKLHKFSRQFPYKDKSFQTIVINQVIQCLEPETLTNVLSESYRLLKNGGVLIIYSPNRHLGQETTSPVSPKKLQKLLLSAGFKNLINKSSAKNLILYTLYRLTNIDLIANTSNFIAYKIIDDPVH